MLGPLLSNLSQAAEQNGIWRSRTILNICSKILHRSRLLHLLRPRRLHLRTWSIKSPINAGPTPPSSITTLGSDSPKIHQYPEVIIRVSLEEDYLVGSEGKDNDGKQRPWLEWFRNIPGAAQRVTVHGIYRSFSTLILLSMPLALWNILPRHPSSAFLAHAMSGNLAEPLGQARGLQSTISLPVDGALGYKNIRKFEHETPPTLQGGANPKQTTVQPTTQESPIKFTDFCGRKLKFPFQTCNT
jgi:hypothetical protein